MKKNAIGLVSIFVLAVVLAIMGLVKVGESANSIIREIIIPALVISAVLGGVAFLTEYITRREKAKNNIAQLKLLSTKLFDSFNNFIKEGGLFEEAWNFVSGGDAERDAKFRDMIGRAREIMIKENMEKTLIIFGKEANDILSKKSKVSSKRLAYCEIAAFSRITNLVGVSCAKMEFLELASLLYLSLQVCSKVVDHDLAFRFMANSVDISPFQFQIERNREILLANEPVENQGLPQIINDIALLIYVEGCREKVS